MDKDIIYPPFISDFAHQKSYSLQDAAQMFMQVIILKNLSHPHAKLMGGGALVLGYQNPRFSEDIDLSAVSKPEELEPSLIKASREIEEWFQAATSLTKPKPDHSTWKIISRWNRASSLKVHVDSQPNKAYTQNPLIIQYPGLPHFLISSLSLSEILAEKLLAVVGRQYLSGRDVFDLWFHWFKTEDWVERKKEVLLLWKKKMKERKLPESSFIKEWKHRLLEHLELKRLKIEWQRYLPTTLQSKDLETHILKRVQWAAERLFS